MDWDRLLRSFGLALADDAKTHENREREMP
jgi:hypothetical protein